MKKRTTAPAVSPWDSEVQFVLWLATCVSVISFLFYFRRGDVLLYGDAIAHMNIARRVIDSRTPGLLQLGTVWLPLPHLLMIPFLLSGQMWQLGIGGSMPSMAAYVLGVVGMFRLVRGIFSGGETTSAAPQAAAHVAAWAAALVYAANPNLMYMQATAMGEALYLTFFIWAVVYFSEFLRSDRENHQDTRALYKCGLWVAAACLTRYDGWFLAVALAAAAILLTAFGKRASGGAFKNLPRRAVVKFILISAAAPALWLAYNGIVYRNPLEFANGPYSAKAIERRMQTAGNPGHPGSGNLVVAGSYFMKSAEANMAENPWLQRTWILLAAATLAAAVFANRLRQPATTETRPLAPLALPFLLLLVPVPFYALSVAYGGVPIFIPAWWPFTHYNVRYGLQLLPAFAALFAMALYFLMRANLRNAKLRTACILALFALLIASYASVWRTTPVCLKEAEVNMRLRNHLESQVADWLRKLPADATLLMYLGDHVGAVQQAGIPLQHTINEGNHRVWKHPSDPEGLWERALADPAHHADYVLAFEGDPVWQAVEGRHLRELVELHVTGQAHTVLYRTR